MPDLIDELVAALPKDREKQPKKPQKDAIDELVAALPQEQMGIGEAFIDRVKQPGVLTETFPNSTMARIGQGALNALGSTGSVVASFLPAKRGTEDLTAAEAIRANLTPSQTFLGDLLPDFQDTPAQSISAPNFGLSGAVVKTLLPSISAEDKKTAANLGIDIAADPTTYFGALSVLKLAKRFGKGSKLVKDAIETLPKDVQEVIQTEIKALPERASVHGELPERTSLLRGDEFITDAEGVTRRVGELPKEPKALKAPGARDEQGNIIAGESTVPPKFKPLKALPSGEGKPRVREITGTDKTGLLSDAQKQQMKADINRKMKKGVIPKSEQKQMNLADKMPEIDNPKKPIKSVADQPNEVVTLPNNEAVDMAKQHAKTVEPPTQKVVQDAINGKVPSDEGVKQLDELNAKRAKERIQARKQVNSDQLPLTKKPILGEAADLTDVPVDKVGKSTMRQFSKEEQDLLNTVKKEFADDVQMQRRGSIPIEQTFIEAEKLKPEVSKLLDEGLPRGTTANAEEVTSMALINRDRMANIILDMLDNVPNKGVLGLEGVKSELGRAMNALRFVSDDPAISKQVRELLNDIKNGDLDKIISKAMDELPGYRKNISGQQQALDELKSKLKLVKKERPC